MTATGTSARSAKPSVELNRAFDWVLQRVHSYIDRFGFRLTENSGRVDDLYVTLDEARRILEREATTGMTARLGLHLLASDAAAGEFPIGGRLGTLRKKFGLDELSLRLLLATAAPALSIDISRLYTFAWADFSQKLPTIGFLGELVADDLDAALAVHDAFHGTAPLVRHGLVELHDNERWAATTPLLHRGVTVPEPVLAWIRGQPPALPARLQSATRFHELSGERPNGPSSLLLPDGWATRLRSAVDHALENQETGPRLLLIGAPGSGRRSSLQDALARTGRGLVEVHLDRLPEDADAADGMLRLVAREALMRNCGLLLRGDVRFAVASPEPGRDQALKQLIGAHPGLLAISARRTVPHIHVAASAVIELELPRHQQAPGIEIWRSALADAGLSDKLADNLASRFDVAPGVAFDIARQVAKNQQFLTAGAADAETAEHIATAFHRRASHVLDQMADRVETTLTWDDVVLPADVLEVLDEIQMHARFRNRVMDEWGFRRVLTYGRGLSCLFHGPPGTGKTMVAAILARSLGQEMFRIDLSRIISKWVGQTEKNLARIFDEAERGRVILLFDEADSLFAKRTEVKGASDRFANMEVNYLLQRMEQFDGISLLTTNFERSFDDAFKRRLKFRVHFPIPSVEQRTLMWERMIPAETPRAPDTYFEELGLQYRMSGGSIKNAVLRAAFYAAQADQPLGHEHLVRAAEAELREMGRN